MYYELLSAPDKPLKKYEVPGLPLPNLFAIGTLTNIYAYNMNNI